MNTTVFRFDKKQLLALFNFHGELATKVYATISQIIIRRMEHANNRNENIAHLYRTNGQRTEHDLLGEGYSGYGLLWNPDYESARKL